MGATLEKVTVNGVQIPVIYENDPTLPIASMQVIFQNSGSIADGVSPGLARMTGMMTNEGSRTRGSVGFAKAMDDKAINLSASCGAETFVIDLSSLTDQWETGVDLLAEMLRAPNYTPATLSKVRTLTLGTIAQKETDFDDVADRGLKALLFAGSPLARPTRGTAQSVQAITLAQIKAFAASHLVLSRVIVVIGGDIPFDRAAASIRTALAPLAPGDNEPLNAVMASDAQKTVTVKKKTEQAYIYFGAPFALKAGDPESYKAKVAAFILGSSGFGSRLMEEIRVKRGLAYSAYCRIGQNRSASSFTGYLQTKLDNQEKAIAIVREVIGEFVARGATEKELDGAKKFLLGSEPLRNETLSARLGRSYNEFYLGLPFGAAKQELDDIRALSVDDLNRFIASHPEITKLSFSIVTR